MKGNLNVVQVCNSEITIKEVFNQLKKRVINLVGVPKLVIFPV